MVPGELRRVWSGRGWRGIVRLREDGAIGAHLPKVVVDKSDEPDTKSNEVYEDKHSLNIGLK